MIELIPFCIQHDMHAPEFLQQLVDEGKVRQMCLGNIFLMNDDEKACFSEKKRLYYRQETLNILRTILPMKKVQFALLDQITMHFNIQDSLLGNGDEPEESKLWLYVDFIKPGKQTFCVRHRDELYVHKFLCQSRDEEIPKGKNC